jgi:uncharacterized membrane protein YfcA
MAGLPPQVANATNRIAIILQCVAGVSTYQRHGVVPWRQVPSLIIPSILGAIIGTLLAAHLDESIFRKVTAVLLIAVALTVFIDPRRWTEARPGGGAIRPIHYPIMFLLAVYGGFLQIGLGTLLLAFFVLLGGYDVVRGNALKFALVPIYQTVALVIFARNGLVNWPIGITLAVGTIIGGIVGAHIVVRKGTRWVRIVVLVSAVAAVVKLLFMG